MKGHLMKLLLIVGGDGSFSSSGRRESCAQRPPLYLPSKRCDRTTVVDPDTGVDEMAYVFSVDELLSTQEVPVETVGLVGGFR